MTQKKRKPKPADEVEYESEQDKFFATQDTPSDPEASECHFAPMDEEGACVSCGVKPFVVKAEYDELGNLIDTSSAVPEPTPENTEAAEEPEEDDEESEEDDEESE